MRLSHSTLKTNRSTLKEISLRIYSTHNTLYRVPSQNLKMGDFFGLLVEFQEINITVNYRFAADNFFFENKTLTTPIAR